MAKITKTVIDSDLRARVFDMINVDALTKINDRQYGMILEDLNGERRYVRVGVIVAEQREELTADELMEAEIAAYEEKQVAKAEKAKAKAEKIERDKRAREAKAKAEAEAEEGE